jgi:hypothetical protein
LGAGPHRMSCPRRACPSIQPSFQHWDPYLRSG